MPWTCFRRAGRPSFARRLQAGVGVTVPIATFSRVGERRWLSWSMSFPTPCGEASNDRAGAPAGRRGYGTLDVSGPPRLAYSEGDDRLPSLRCLGADGAHPKKGPVAEPGATAGRAAGRRLVVYWLSSGPGCHAVSFPLELLRL